MKTAEYEKNRENYLKNGRAYAQRTRKSARQAAKKLGLTLEQYDAMGTTCAICGEGNLEGRNRHVDHCHATGKVRDVLCKACNLMIGHAKDRAELLLKGVDYLKKHTSRLDAN